MLTNSTQTLFTENLISKLDLEHQEMFHNFIDKIPMIKRLCDPNRKRAKDRPKKDYKYVIRNAEDKPIIPLEYRIENKIIVDITNPHLLEDMDYFRPSCLYFKEHGCYTKLYPNGNVQSEYYKFWQEEKRRCLEGYLRESDGEWISGYNYFYWNYSVIQKDIAIGEASEDGSIQAERITEFGDTWDSDYWFFHYIEQGEQAGKHGKVLKCRGRGYSFKGGSMDARNAVLIKNSKSYSMAFEKEYLNKDGIFNKASDSLDWCATHTPWPRLRLVNSVEKLHIKLGYKNEKLNTNSGQLSEIIGVTLKDDPQKARGKRGKLIKWEEDGKFPGLKQAWKIAQKSIEQGNRVFGYQISFGTGGTKGSDFEASEEFFYHPDGYKILGLENVFDINGSGECGLFIAEYMNRSDCYDKDGNSDVVKALIQLLTVRQKVKFGSSDPNTIVQECAESPITPQEAVMKVEGSYFPIVELKKHLAELRTNSKIADSTYIGRMEVSDGKIKFKQDSNLRIIDKYPHTELRPGAIHIYAHPVIGEDGNIPRFRYLAGNDSVEDDDGSKTASLLSTQIMNSLTREIVAEYTGRPQITNDYFEQLRLLSNYYGIAGTLNYENNKKAFYAFCNNKNSLHILCETPEILRSVSNITISKIGNKRYGTNASTTINNYGLMLTKRWLLEPAYSQPEGRDEPLLNLHTIKSPAFVEELIAYHSLGNYDRISAFGMLMILAEDLHKITSTLMNVQQNPIALDPFWFKGRTKNGNSYSLKTFPSIITNN